jgi:phosphoenolpyruvate carboxylase
VELVRVGSRPQKRRAAKTVRDLRAIPWVFRWLQSRQLIPAWYGLGTALEQFGTGSADREQERGLLRAMYERWPFFRSLIENSEIGLYQVDLDIVRYYIIHLAQDREKADAILKKISEEYARTCEQVQQLTGEPLLRREEDLPLERSITMKRPYLDPLNYIQVRLLKDYRRRQEEGAPPGELELYERAIVSSIEGIATGLGTAG